MSERSWSEEFGRCPDGVDFVGASKGVLQTMELLRLVAKSRCDTILVLGETGTGKELAARAVHAWRCGPEAPFVAVNCAALTTGLLESELFGHVRGSFTGADRDRPGLFEQAGDGTIFLDEISEMPSDLQAKLLRVLQERTFRQVGGAKTLRCAATVVASSNRDLHDEARDGRFREDLYHRLAVFPVRIPPLRCESRRDDIPLLAEYFVRTATVHPPGQVDGLTDEAVQHLAAHDWPGNVRELKNVIERAMILEQNGPLTPRSLLIDAGAPRPIERPAAPEPSTFSLESAEQEFIRRALRETQWHRTRAAALLGITRATLHAKLKRYGIHPPAADPARPIEKVCA